MESAADEVPGSGVFEVSTDSSDALRARIRVVGELTGETVPLLASAIRTHLSAGRRYLRVDVAAARTTEPAVLDALTELHDRTTQLGGMLVFETAAQAAAPDAATASDVLGAHVAGLRSRG